MLHPFFHCIKGTEYTSWQGAYLRYILIETSAVSCDLGSQDAHYGAMVRTRVEYHALCTRVTHNPARSALYHVSALQQYRKAKLLNQQF